MRFFSSTLICLILPIWGFTQNVESSFNKKLDDYIVHLQNEFNSISIERKQVLNDLSQYLLDQQNAGGPAKVTFMSRYNAERTQLCQIWLNAATQYYDLDRIYSFSAGFVPAKFNPKIAEALKRAGFMTEKMIGSTTPTYQTKVNKKSSPILTFSKHYTNTINPKATYAAVFVEDNTTSEIEMLSTGANGQFFLPYLKPIEFKDKKFEAKEYDTLCRTIGLEMLYVAYLTRQARL